MNHNLEIQKLLLKVDATQNVEDKISLLKQAINAADTNNDVEWGVDLRLDLIRMENKTPHSIESFPAFSWILDAYDNNPDLLDEDDFLWQYKWMVESAIVNPNISLQQVDYIISDFRERMKRNGYTEHSYYNLLAFRQMFLGEYTEARKSVDMRDNTSRDGMSDCLACELNTTVAIELRDGKFDDAIVKAHDLITHKSVCAEQPFATFCDFVYYLERAKDRRATDFYDKAEEELSKLDKNRTSHLSEIAQLIYYLNNNNRDKAWQYFEECAHWEIEATEGVSFDFAIFVLPLLKSEGTKVLNLHTSLPYYNSDNSYVVKDLYDYYYSKAKRLAEQFDERNGNNLFKEELAEAAK